MARRVLFCCSRLSRAAYIGAGLKKIFLLAATARANNSFLGFFAN